MKTYIFKKEFMKNIYTTNFLIPFPVNHFKKFFNFLDGIRFSLNNGIQNYPENRLVMVSASFLDRPYLMQIMMNFLQNIQKIYFLVLVILIFMEKI